MFVELVPRVIISDWGQFSTFMKLTSVIFVCDLIVTIEVKTRIDDPGSDRRQNDT